SASGEKKADIVAGELNDLALETKEVHRGQMERVESTHGPGKRLERSGQYWRRELDQSDPSQESARLVAIGLGEVACMDSRPQFVLEEAVRGQRLLPQALRWRSILGQELGQSHRGIEVNHRSARSSARSRS